MDARSYQGQRGSDEGGGEYCPYFRRTAGRQVASQSPHLQCLLTGAGGLRGRGASCSMSDAASSSRCSAARLPLGRSRRMDSSRIVSARWELLKTQKRGVRTPCDKLISLDEHCC